MSKTKEPAGKSTFKEKISLLLQKNRILLLSALGALVAILIVSGIVISIRTNHIEEGTLQMEAMIKTYETEWLGAADDEAKDVAEEKINGQIDTLIADYNDSFPGQKAMQMKGDLAYNAENWTEAVDAYVMAADADPDNYLAPVVLMYAASAAEEAGDNVKAIELFTRLTEDYSGILEESSRALFNIGRLNELSGDVNAALDSYNKLLDLGDNSPWSALAQTRVIDLEVK